MKARIIKRGLFVVLGLFAIAAFLQCSNPTDVVQVVGGSFETPTVDGITVIEYPFTFDISRLGSGFTDSDINVVASGFKKSSAGVAEEPLMIRWSVSGTTLTLSVWDASGVEFKSTSPVPPQWSGKRVELSYVVTRY